MKKKPSHKSLKGQISIPNTAREKDREKMLINFIFYTCIYRIYDVWGDFFSFFFLFFFPYRFHLLEAVPSWDRVTLKSDHGVMYRPIKLPGEQTNLPVFLDRRVLTCMPKTAIKGRMRVSANDQKSLSRAEYSWHWRVGPTLGMEMNKKHQLRSHIYASVTLHWENGDKFSLVGRVYDILQTAAWMTKETLVATSLVLTDLWYDYTINLFAIRQANRFLTLYRWKFTLTPANIERNLYSVSIYPFYRRYAADQCTGTWTCGDMQLYDNSGSSKVIA